MKRGLIGGILMVLLLFAGLTEMKTVRRELNPMADTMEQAAQAVLRGVYKKTAALTAKARAAWEDSHFRFSCLSHQQAVRQIDGLYDEVEVFLQAKEKVHCSAACQALKNQLRALLEDQKLDLPNLL